ncbi:MAG: M48 family metallopeptidase [Isosphaeraceae bacterium]
MLPIPLLIAMVLAFGIDPPQTGVPPADVLARVLETFGGITLVAALAFGLGFWVALRASRFGYSPSRLRRRYTLAARLLTIFSLVVYGWIIHSVGWSKVVRANWGLGACVMVDDILVLLPFLLIQLLVWWGLYIADRALQARYETARASSLGRHLTLKARHSLGLMLPIILLYVVRRDMIARIWPAWAETSLAEPVEITLLGALVLLVSPLFVRLAWPTRSLESGPLRRQLEEIAQRVGFRFTDILVWDTGGTMINACVTGVLPRFRYVLLTDALIESLTAEEAAAVFGHEIGHLAHRHLLYFAFFFLGSLGILSSLADGVAQLAPVVAKAAWLTPWSAPVASDVFQGTTLLCALALYVWVVFGSLSRRFERQADVFGSKVASFSPTRYLSSTDSDDLHSTHATPGTGLMLRSQGIRIFADALANVARYNGLDPNGPSWRHGSIAQRIAFLHGLDGHPDGERIFQEGVRKLRLCLGVVLVVGILLSILPPSFWLSALTQAWGQAR